MRLVIGAFATLGEAESAVRALLEAGYRQDMLAAHSRTGGGRVLLAGRVPVQLVGDPARLVSRAERARAWAAAGAALGILAGGALLVAGPALGVDVVAALASVLIGTWAVVLVLALCALIGGALGALARRTDGLPHDLAFRYGVRLDQGDTVISVRAAPGKEAQAAQELLGIHGAILAHVTRGRIEPLGVQPPAQDMAPSEN